MLSEKALEVIALAIERHEEWERGAKSRGWIVGPDILPEAILSALKEEGLVIVPREPTEEMERVGIHLRNIQDNSAFRNTAEIYRAMLAARGE